MKPEGKEFEKPKKEIFKKWWFWAFIGFGILFNLAGMACNLEISFS